VAGVRSGAVAEIMQPRDQFAAAKFEIVIALSEAPA
jgi:hypothetical protein